ncbi:MAG: glycosyltransferase [Cyclobacteriaceae bacterium]
MTSAIRSALSQTYANIEVIVVDDASTDGSQEEIRATIGQKNVRFISLERNVGNCAAFNRGFEISNGEYVIDLAGDDLLLPTRVELGINDFINAFDKAGVHFTDAFYINEDGQPTGTHYDRNPDGQLVSAIPQGDIYQDLIERYFICPPSMMIKSDVLKSLGGYNESLHYEDFDFWIRSSRNFQYIFNPAPLVKYRRVKKSHSSSQTKWRTAHLLTTFQVCEKIFELNKTPAEHQALIKRCQYEIRQCLKTFNWGLIFKYRKLIKEAKYSYRRLSSDSSIEQ